MFINKNPSAVVKPNNKPEDIKEIIHGNVVRDPYRWLENKDDPEVKKWIDGQNINARKYLDSVSQRKDIGQKLEKILDAKNGDAPYPAPTFLPNGKQRYFVYVSSPEKEHPVLCYKDGEDGELNVAVDPNKISKDGKVAILDYFPNHDGTVLAYALSEGGVDTVSVNIIDLRSGQIHEDKLENLKLFSMEWVSHNYGFYYSAWPDIETHSAPEKVAHVYFHKMGTQQSEDKEVFGVGLGANKSCSLDRSSDGKYLIISVSDNVNNELYYKKFSVSDNKITPLITGRNAEFYLLDIHGKNAYILTDLDAPNYSVVRLNMNNPNTKWKTVIPECDAVIENAVLVNNKIIVNYLDNIYSKIRIFSLRGALKKEVDLPENGYATLPDSNAEGDSAFLNFGSFLSPTRTYRLDLKNYSIEAVSDNTIDFDFTKFEFKQIMYKSADGTEIPMFLVHKKDIKLDGNNPVLLYGYGGFNDPAVPKFNATILPFIEDGGVYAVANIRGGGEFGKTWYNGGRHKNKKRSFEDFIYAAEWLVGNNYTNKDRLAIRGRSNGGLLTAAAVTMRPDLFKAAIVEMPISDMIRGSDKDISPLCSLEYGDPKKAEDIGFMLEYSPYHNIKEGEHFPSILVITGENDTRCDPMHARKFAAHLQDSTASQNPILLLTIKGIGHGGELFPVPDSIQKEWTADWLAFVYNELGMRASDGKSRDIKIAKRD